MIRTDAFVKDMCRVLNPYPGLTFAPEHRQKGVEGCVDVVGTDKTGKTRVLIEVELRRYGPVGNVIKIWKRLTKDKCPDDVIFIQVFSNFYSQKTQAKQYAAFIAEKMVKEYSSVNYILLEIDYKPGARKSDAPVMKGAGRRRHHAEHLANTIRSTLKKLRSKGSKSGRKALVPA
jgi:hypothetical protein